MQLRRDRVNLHGKTNCDFHSESVQKSSMIPRLEYAARSTNFDQIVKNKMAHSMQHPVQTQKEFYKEKGRDIIQKPKLERKRFGQLEEKELQKSVWVGDSELIYDNMHTKGQKNQEETKYVGKREKNVLNLASQKHEQHGNASQETQLIGMEEYSHQTLEGRIDINKVREIRRALRRRYASRKNFQKIFSQWDKEGKGYISTKNILEMINRMGLNLNFDEARVLVASADQDRSGDLSLDEFMELIFNDNDTMNVNLKQLKIIKEADDNLGDEQIYDHIHQDVKKMAQNHHQNALKIVLKNKLQNLHQICHEYDEQRTGHISYQKLKDTIKRLQIQDNLVNEEDIKQIYQDYQINDQQFDYKSFLHNLNLTSLNTLDQSSQNQIKKQPKLVTNLLAPTQQEEKLRVLDCTRMSSQGLEKIRVRANKFIKQMLKYLPKKSDMDNLIIQNLNDPGSISAEDISEKIKKFLGSVGVKTEKRDVESLLSIMQFNDNRIPPQEVSRIIYDEDDTQFFLRCSLRNKGPAPAKSQSIIVDDQNLQTIDEEPVTKTFYDRDRGLGKTAPNLPQKMVSILQRLEDHAFRASAKQYDIFKAFDMDKDGFISQKDFVQHVQKMEILTNKEIKYLLTYLDPNNQGSLKFSEFSSRIFPGMTTCAPNGDQLVVSSLYPAKERNENLREQLPKLKKQKNQIDTQKPLGTRFGATPAHQNTFLNIQSPAKDSAMYLDEKIRFSKDQDARIQFQKDEQQKQAQIKNGRLQQIRFYQDTLEQRIEQNYINSVQKDDEKCRTKGLAVWNYEQRAHLKNDWL